LLDKQIFYAESVKQEMLDTAMVLWTRGVYKRFLLAMLAFAILFVGIYMLVSTFTAGIAQWPNIANAVSSPTTSSTRISTTSPTQISTASAAHRTASLTQAHFSTIPDILQNPSLPTVTPTLTSTPETGATALVNNTVAPTQSATASSNATTQPAPIIPTTNPTPRPVAQPAPKAQATSHPTSNQQPSLFPTISDPSSPFPGSALSNRLSQTSSRVTLLKLRDIFWLSLGVSCLLLLLCAGCITMLHFKAKGLRFSSRS
jgi:hypothetical protein